MNCIRLKERIWEKSNLFSNLIIITLCTFREKIKKKHLKKSPRLKSICGGNVRRRSTWVFKSQLLLLRRDCTGLQLVQLSWPRHGRMDEVQWFPSTQRMLFIWITLRSEATVVELIMRWSRIYSCVVIVNLIKMPHHGVVVTCFGLFFSLLRQGVPHRNPPVSASAGENPERLPPSACLWLPHTSSALIRGAFKGCRLQLLRSGDDTSATKRWAALH